MLPTLGAVYSCVIGTEALLSSLEGTVSIGGVRAAFLRAEASEDEELAVGGLRPTRVGAQRAGDLLLYVIAIERMSTIRRDLRTALTCRIAAHICTAVMINAAQCDDVAHAAGVVPVLREQSIEGGAAYHSGAKGPLPSGRGVNGPLLFLCSNTRALLPVGARALTPCGVACGPAPAGASFQAMVRGVPLGKPPAGTTGAVHSSRT